MKKIIQLLCFICLFNFSNVWGSEIFLYKNKLLHKDYICYDLNKINNLEQLNNSFYEESSQMLTCDFASGQITKHLKKGKFKSLKETSDRIINVAVFSDGENNSIRLTKDLEDIKGLIYNSKFKDEKIELRVVLYIDIKEDFNFDDKLAKTTDSPLFSHNIFKQTKYYDFFKQTKADFYILYSDDYQSYGGIVDSKELNKNKLKGEGIIIGTKPPFFSDFAAYTMSHEFGHILGLSHDLLTENRNKEFVYSGNNESPNKKNIPYGYGDYNDKSVSVMGYARSVILPNGEVKRLERVNRFTIDKDLKKIDFSKNAKNIIEFHYDTVKDYEMAEEIAKYLFPALHNTGILVEILDFFPALEELYKKVGVDTADSYITPSSSEKALEITLPAILNRKTIDENKISLINKNTVGSDNIFLFNSSPLVLLNKGGADKYFLGYGSFEIDFKNNEQKIFIPYTSGYLNEQVYSEVKIKNFEPDKDFVLISKEFENFDIEESKIIKNGYISGIKRNYIINKKSSLIIEIEFNPELGLIEDNFELKLTTINESSKNKTFNKEGAKFYNSFQNIKKDFQKIISVYFNENEYVGSDRDDNYYEIGGSNYSDNIYGLNGKDILGYPVQNNTNSWWLGANTEIKDYYGDYFYGGTGDDTIYGTRHGDTYFYKKADGNDVIYEKSDLTLDSDRSWNKYLKDYLILEDYLSTEVKLSRDGYDLLVLLDNEVITIKNYLKKENGYYIYAIEEIIFKDNSYWTLNKIIKKALIVETKDNVNDHVSGLEEYENTFKSSTGNDKIYGSTNKDRYIISDKIGHTEIRDYGGDDILEFQGISKNQLLLSLRNNNLYIYKDYSDLIVTIYDYSGAGHIETIKMKGFNTSNGGDINDLITNYNVLIGTDYPDYYNLLTTCDNCENFFISKKGSDNLYGKSFNDRYYYKQEDGIDTINDPNGEDYVIFGDIKSNQVSYLRYRNDLKITLNETNKIIIKNHFLTENAIEYFVFKNKTLTKDQVATKVPSKNEEICVGEELNRNQLISLIDSGKDYSKACVGTITDFSGLFENKTVHYDFVDWDVSNGVNFSRMFKNAYIPVVDSLLYRFYYWNVSSGEDFSYMFENARDGSAVGFEYNLSKWNVSNGKNFSYMFSIDRDRYYPGWNGFFANRNLNSGEIELENIADVWDISNGEDFSYMFYGQIYFRANLMNWNNKKNPRTLNMLKDTSIEEDCSKYPKFILSCN